MRLLIFLAVLFVLFFGAVIGVVTFMDLHDFSQQHETSSTGFFLAPP